MMTLLQVESITKRFGGVVANSDVSFSVDEGQIVGLIGPNGAGKSTMFNMISSIFPPTEGNILFCGKRIDSLPSYKVAPLGISRTFQNLQVFKNMTVIENVMVGQHMRTKQNLSGVASMLLGISKNERKVYEEAMDILSFFNLELLYDQKASSLSLGKLRLLEFARAYATEPKLLLLDEIAAGLNHSETSEMSELIKRVRDSGVTILVVEHDMDLVMSICDKLVVLDQGMKIAEGAPKEIQANEAVIAAYLGAEIEEEVV
ncbi:high-affinity branched-chain amino acid ABC transporter ATP-binding protein LivG [Sporosarcina sp. P34]|uniref:ABC transporter ATP-binding protein n=1 Tax=Sporosarcina sp. P34 TaxID=2048247 RepID=UPI000C1637C9|nr:ABC transporter ATP-binding protein [Sporosarcina sp. P34]PID14766.1 high-affinity branched-chain amino acid ABC transporter ATP-binding protein LivG [Sporosarcina sp. P34]